jgi:hypothetical protein
MNYDKKNFKIETYGCTAGVGSLMELLLRRTPVGPVILFVNE